MFITTGCVQCTPKEPPPYIRTQPGIESCGQMCDLFKKLDCKPYYDDVTTEDGGKIGCKEFCEYEMTNSIPLNAKCIVDNLKDCSQIEIICR